jgi:hypothetical protein
VATVTAREIIFGCDECGHAEAMTQVIAAAAILLIADYGSIAAAGH